MAAELQLDRLRTMLAAAEKRVERIKRIMEAVQEDPDLLEPLVGATLPAVATARRTDATHANANGTAAPRPQAVTERLITGGPVTMEHFHRIANHLTEHGNAPLPVSAIAKAIQLPNSAVIQVVYKTHKALFDKVPIPGHKTNVMWKLKENWRAILEANTPSG